MSAERRRVLRNAVSAYGARGLLALSALIVTPVLYRHLGAGGFGTWSVIFTFSTIFGLVELGFARGITKVSSELLARGRRAELQEAMGASVAQMGVLGLLASAVSVALGLLAPGLAAVGERDAFTAAMLVLGAERLVYFPLATCMAVLAGHQRYDLVSGAGAANTAGFSAAALAIVAADGGVLAVTVAYAAAHLGMGVLCAVLLKRVDPALSLRPLAGSAAVRRRLLAMNGFVLLADSMTFIGQRMDTLVIAAIRSPAAAGPFAAVLKLQSGVQSLTLPFVFQLMPMVSDLWARGRRDEVLRRTGLATRVSLQMILPVAAALAVLAPDAIDVWLGAGAPDSANAILAVLMVVQVVTLTTAPAEQVLVGLGRVRAVGALAAVEGLSNLVLSIVLVSAYGAVGAAIGTLATSALISPLRVPLAARALGAPVAALVRSSLVPALLSSLPALAGLAAVRLALDAGPARLFAGLAVVVAAAAAVGAAQLGPRRVARELRSLRPGAHAR